MNNFKLLIFIVKVLSFVLIGFLFYKNQPSQALFIIALEIIIPIISNFFKSRERTRNIKAIAAQMGLSFSKRGDDKIIPIVQDITLFQGANSNNKSFYNIFIRIIWATAVFIFPANLSGKSTKVKNLLKGEVEGNLFAIFDYYTKLVEPSGSDSSENKTITSLQTVILFVSEDLQLPRFSILAKDKNFIDKIAKKIVKWFRYSQREGKFPRLIAAIRSIPLNKLINLLKLLLVLNFLLILIIAWVKLDSLTGLILPLFIFVFPLFFLLILLDKVESTRQYSSLFDSLYDLHGNQYIHTTFSSDIFAFYEAEKNLCTQATGNRLICYRANTITDPQELQYFLDTGLKVLQLFKAQSVNIAHKATFLSPDETDDLSSTRSVDYTRLRDLLKAGKWKEADIETTELIFKIAGRLAEGRLDNESINKLPCVDLRTIDQLWVKYSNGRFGFSVQKQIWQSLGGQPDLNHWKKTIKFNQINWQLINYLGWSKHMILKRYNDLTFSLDAPPGHLPVLWNEWNEEQDGYAAPLDRWVLFSRMENCQ